jgi:hypothetical protein
MAFFGSGQAPGIGSLRHLAAAHEHRIREPRLRGRCGDIIFGDIETPELDIAHLLGASQDHLPAHHEWLPAHREPDLLERQDHQAGDRALAHGRD